MLKKLFALRLPQKAGAFAHTIMLKENKAKHVAKVKITKRGANFSATIALGETVEKVGGQICLKK